MNLQQKNMTAFVNQQTYDLFASEALLNPYPLYKRMREEDPVHYSESFGYWVLTRYKDVEAALYSDDVHHGWGVATWLYCKSASACSPS